MTIKFLSLIAIHEWKFFMKKGANKLETDLDWWFWVCTEFNLSNSDHQIKQNDMILFNTKHFKKFQWYLIDRCVGSILEETNLKEVTKILTCFNIVASSIEIILFEELEHSKTKFIK